ncbi:hypothetical protein [Cetobacterium sp.]|uniref:hypothetical protein n=1 Tax=Cetobacterium sp. TaxID=2071632 RepID=UPI003F415790
MRYIIKNNSINNYTQLYNEIIHNCKCNLEVLGFATLLLSKPPDWNINPYGLMKELKIGKDRVLRLLSALEKNGYIYKLTNVQFAKKGEQKVFYYMFDCKELLKETFPEGALESTSQLPLIAPLPTSSDMDIPHVDIPDVDTPQLEYAAYTNKDITKTISNQENINKKNTKLTIREFISSVVDEKTAANILNANPNLTLEEFQNIYKRILLEYKKNFCKDINAGLVLAVSGRWKFRTQVSDESSNVSDDEKTRRVVVGNYNYYLSYFKEIGSCNPKEILQKFQKDCTKYDANIVDIYTEKLKKELGI